MAEISDDRMDQLIRRAKNAATRCAGVHAGSACREVFSDEAYKTTLEQLIANELGLIPESSTKQSVAQP